MKLKDLLKEDFGDSPLNAREMEASIVKPKFKKYKAFVQFGNKEYSDVSKEYEDIYKNKWTHLNLPRNHPQQWAKISNDKKVIKAVVYSDGGMVGAIYIKEGYDPKFEKQFSEWYKKNKDSESLKKAFEKRNSEKKLVKSFLNFAREYFYETFYWG